VEYKGKATLVQHCSVFGRLEREVRWVQAGEKAERWAQYTQADWLVCTGTKICYTAKGWGHARYQQLVDRLSHIRWVQVGEKHHGHQPLEGAMSLIGRTNLRQLTVIAYHAEGGLGGESLLNHVFAAFGKPFVAILSGSLPPSWVWYPHSTILCRAQT
jgi:ADP-heptose:LPS heptosyltransferase